MSTRARWLVAGVIVALAAVVALWPRDNAPVPTPPAPPARELTEARASAALRPCLPGPTGSGPAVLRDVRAECLADGTTVSVGDLLAGRPVLVNVWATWCQPCREELPVLAEYAATPGAVTVLGLAVQSRPADALELLATLRVRFPQLLEPEGDSVRTALRVPDALPASYLIGSDGTVHFVTDPRLFRSIDQVRTTVTRYLPTEGSGR